MKNSSKSFFAALALLFGMPWLVLVISPWHSLRGLDRVPYEPKDEVADTYFPPLRTGAALGAQIYGRSGCAYCHSQMIRPTYAGVDRWRDGWAGREDKNLARETRAEDFLGESYAYLGMARIGPDLSNVGNRIKDASWHYRHLFNPRSMQPASVMPSYRNLFERRRVIGAESKDAVATEEVGGIKYEWVPSNEAKALVLYLVTMRKDHKLPARLVSTK